MRGGVASGSLRQGSAIIIASTMMLASVLPVAWLEAQPRGATEVAAIFAPWASRERAFAAVAAAGGLVVRQGAFDTILVAHGPDAGFAERVYAAGAWAVIDPMAFGGCLARVRGGN